MSTRKDTLGYERRIDAGGKSVERKRRVGVLGLGIDM
jgi:hypothetical protein